MPATALRPFPVGMLKGPYQGRRRLTLRQRLRRLRLRDWLWIAAAVIGAVVIGLLIGRHFA